MLDDIAEKFFGVKRKNPMQGIFGDIFKVITFIFNSIFLSPLHVYNPIVGLDECLDIKANPFNRRELIPGCDWFYSRKSNEMFLSKYQ